MMISRAGKPKTEKSPGSRRDWQVGFTLVELMFVLLILCTFASLVIPRLQLSRLSLIFQESSRLLLADLERARLEAIQSGTPRAIVFSRPERGAYALHRYWGRESEPWQFVQADSASLADEATKERRLPGDVRLESNLQRVLFFPNGSATSCWIKILSRNGYRQTLVFVDGITGVARRLETAPM